MHRRLILATVLVATLAVTAGCVGTNLDDEALNEDISYTWSLEEDVDANITLTEGAPLQRGEFAAVYRVNQSEIELYHRELTRDRPLSIRGVAFQYSNGTVVSLDSDDVSIENRRTVITMPADAGKVAFTADRQTKQLRHLVPVGGTYRVTLPPDHRVADFLLSDVSPGGYTTERHGEQTTIVWEEIEPGTTILLHYYFERDRLLFWGLTGVLSVIGLAGYAYYSRQIKRLIKWRKEQGLDVDYDDDDRRRPPPGMG